MANDAFFLGIEKGRVLAVLKPHIFFDRQMKVALPDRSYEHCDWRYAVRVGTLQVPHFRASISSRRPGGICLPLG